MAHWFAEVDEWGIPEWRNAEAYGVDEDWTLPRWRWEFTRRRSDYRADFEMALAEHGPVLCAEDFPEEALGQLPGIRSLPFPHPSGIKYSLTEMFDPVLSDWMGIGPETEPYWMSGMVYGALEGSEPEGKYLTLTFNLSRPLAPQLEEARQHLEDMINIVFYNDEADRCEPPTATKMHMSKWLTYLRLIDAKAAGASLADMSREILAGTNSRGDQRTAGNMLDQARAQMFRF